jgi:Tol biopolymer transport system component
MRSNRAKHWQVMAGPRLPGAWLRAASLGSSTILTAAAAVPQECSVIRVSEAAPGIGGSGDSRDSDISADGRVVAFGTLSSNLAVPDLNGAHDVVVRDLNSNAFEHVNVNSTGVQGNGGSTGARISGDGNFVAFTSVSSNLDPRDTDGNLDVFLRDRSAKTTRLVSIRRGPGSSPAGPHVNSVSHDGRFVVFHSWDSNFPVEDSSGPVIDVFLVDMLTEEFELISQTETGERLDFHSRDGILTPDARFVVFESQATNFGLPNPQARSQLWQRDRYTGTIRPVTVDPQGGLSRQGLLDNQFSISDDGRYVAFTGNGYELVPGAPLGWFNALLVRDMLTNVTEIAGFTMGGDRPNNSCLKAQLSSDGRYVGFWSWAKNMFPGQPYYDSGPQIYRYDRLTKTTKLISLTWDGNHPNSFLDQLSMSADGRSFSFNSIAFNIVPGDFGLTEDVFLVSCERDEVLSYCAAIHNSDGCKAHLSSRGSSSLSQAEPLELHLSGLPSQTSVLLLLGASGPAFDLIGPGQFLCVDAPRSVTPFFSSGGSSSLSCSGSVALELNAYMAAHPEFAAPAGSIVYLQAWYVDHGARGGGGALFSDALAFEVQP